MVEWKKLGDVCRTVTPPKKLEKDLYGVEGLYPIIDQGKNEIVGYTDDETALVPINEYVLFGDHTRYVKYYQGQFAQGADGLKILLAADGIMPRFFFYSFANAEIPSRGYSRHWSIAKDLLIPIPSLEDQQRIVGVLDTFTADIDNLKKQIAQRRKQYEYYRDQLLDLEGKPGVEMKTLGEVCVIKGEYGLSVPSKPYDGIRYVRITDITDDGMLNDDAVSAACDDNLKEPLQEGDILFARTGATVGKSLFFLNSYGQCIYAGYLIRYRPNPLFVLPKFIFHFSHSNIYLIWVKSNLVEGAQPNINAQKYNSLAIPIPSLQEQQRIVSILDTFEASIQNLEAQLKQREKQYEYYRKKLLTFE